MKYSSSRKEQQTKAALCKWCMCFKAHAVYKQQERGRLRHTAPLPAGFLSPSLYVSTTLPLPLCICSGRKHPLCYTHFFHEDSADECRTPRGRIFFYGHFKAFQSGRVPAVWNSSLRKARNKRFSLTWALLHHCWCHELHTFIQKLI